MGFIACKPAVLSAMGLVSRTCCFYGAKKKAPYKPSRRPAAGKHPESSKVFLHGLAFDRQVVFHVRRLEGYPKNILRRGMSNTEKASYVKVQDLSNLEKPLLSCIFLR